MCVKEENHVCTLWTNLWKIFLCKDDWGHKRTHGSGSLYLYVRFDDV